MSGAWPVVALGDVLEDVQPGFASGKHNSDGTGIPHLRPMNVSTEGVLDRSVVKFVDPALADKPSRRLRSGDVLFNNTNSPELVGKTALFTGDDEPAFSNHMTRLRVDESRALPDFVALRLHHAWREGWFAARCNNHVSQASIGREVLVNFEIRLPDLATQRDISAVARRAHERRTSCHGHLEAGRLAVQRLRQAVLAAATGGRFAEHTQWQPTPLKELVHTLDQGWSPKCENRPAEGREWGVIKTTAVQGMRFVASENKALPSSLEPRPALEIQKDDILITRAGPRSRVGIACVVRDAAPRLMICDKVYRLRLNDSLALPEFIGLALNTQRMTSLIDDMKTGTSESGMNLTQAKVLEMKIAVPSLVDQRAAIEAVHRFSTLADSVDARIDGTKQTVDRSARAIRAKAFRGDFPIRAAREEAA